MFTFSRIYKLFTNAEQWELFTENLQFTVYKKFTISSSLNVCGKFTLCSQFSCSQKIYWKFTICSKTGAAARSRNLWTVCKFFVNNSGMPAFTFHSQIVYRKFTNCSQLPANRLARAFASRGYISAGMNLKSSWLHSYRRGVYFRIFLVASWELVFSRTPTLQIYFPIQKTN